MKIVLSRVAVCGVVSVFAQSAIATDLPNRSTSPSLPLSLMNYSGGNDWARYEIAPNWSRELGWSLKGAFGSYITNDLAMGAIVEYGQDKREYLTNAGIRLSDKLSFIGTVGMLEEHREFVADAGKETVQQMEYGASLKGAYNYGIFRGFELNGYLADAKAKSDNIETGKLYGTQILTNVNLTDSTRIRFGGGYEWLHWDEGEDNNAMSFRADGVQKLTNNLSAVVNVKLGASEDVYGGGLNYNLGDRTNSNVIGINYEHIEGKNGIQSDQRVQVSWTMGMGVGPNKTTSSNGGKPNSKSNALTFDDTNAPTNTLLADVMKRPEFLPNRVLARSNKSSVSCTIIPNVTFDFIDNPNRYYDMINIPRASFTAEQLTAIDNITSADIEVYSGNSLANLVLYSPPYSPQLVFQSDDGGTLYFQFSSDVNGTQTQSAFTSGDYVKIRLNLPEGCIEITDQYFGG